MVIALNALREPFDFPFDFTQGEAQDGPQGDVTLRPSKCNPATLNQSGPGEGGFDHPKSQP